MHVEVTEGHLLKTESNYGSRSLNKINVTRIQIAYRQYNKCKGHLSDDEEEEKEVFPFFHALIYFSSSSSSFPF